jgi:hypothetical protein
MKLLEIEVAGATIRRRTELAEDVAIEELIPSMVTLAGDGSPADGRWYVYRPGGERLGAGSTLASAGVAHCDALYIARATPAIDSELPDAPPNGLDDLTPSQRVGTIVPERQVRRRRVLDAIRALLGTRSARQTIDGTAWERMTGTWRWGDHHRRLEWIIGRPRLTRTVTIGVCTPADGGTSAVLAIEIARSLAAARADRVLLMDGDPVRAGVTRSAGGRNHTISSVAEGVEVVDARFRVDRVAVLGCDLSGTDIPDFGMYRRALDRIRPSAGIVVIDCGPVGSLLADLCEQIVVVTDSPFDPGVRRSLGHRPTVVAVAPIGPAGMAGIDESLPTAIGAIGLVDDLSVWEIDAVLAHGWARLGACA